MPKVRIGVLGFGRVGRAVARAVTAARHELETTGFNLGVDCALVRDRDRPRPDGIPVTLVDREEAFFDRCPDVVVEVLGGVEPARSLVARALDRGIPVVTANKSLVARYGPTLCALAARRGASLRYEASALAGVPFLGTLARRPLAACVSRISGIVNGTSHYVLTTMEEERVSFAEALERARALGLAEPDASNDVDGTDAAEQLALLAAHCGAPGLAPEAIERTSVAAVGPDDLTAARRLGGVLKPVAWLSVETPVPQAFVGPAFVSGEHPFASLRGSLNGIRLQGRFIGDLFYSGTGAGPDVTAATLLDDVIETVRTAVPDGPPAFAVAPGDTRCEAPDAPWFVRLRFTDEPDHRRIAAALGRHRIWIRQSERPVRDGAGWLAHVLTCACPREQLFRSLSALSTAPGAAALAIRALDGRDS